MSIQPIGAQFGCNASIAAEVLPGLVKGLGKTWPYSIRFRDSREGAPFTSDLTSSPSFTLLQPHSSPCCSSTPALGPLHWLFPLLVTPFPYVPAGLTPLPP